MFIVILIKMKVGILEFTCWKFYECRTAGPIYAAYR